MYRYSANGGSDTGSESLSTSIGNKRNVHVSIVFKSEKKFLGKPTRIVLYGPFAAAKHNIHFVDVVTVKLVFSTNTHMVS